MIVEDTSTTREEIVASFNERVTELVESVTERKEVEGKKLDCKERKTDYFARLEEMSDGAIVIAITDKITNMII